jgi:hypothetical protein
MIPFSVAAASPCPAEINDCESRHRQEQVSFCLNLSHCKRLARAEIPQFPSGQKSIDFSSLGKFPKAAAHVLWASRFSFRKVQY